MARPDRLGRLDKRQLFELELARQKQWSKFISQMVPWVGRSGFVLALWLPMRALAPMVADLAGKTTTVSGALQVSISVSVVTTIGYVVENRRGAKARKKVAEQSVKLSVYEARALEKVGIGKSEG